MVMSLFMYTRKSCTHRARSTSNLNGNERSAATQHCLALLHQLQQQALPQSGT